MKFEEAVAALREGKKIRLPHWGKGIYVYMTENCLVDQGGIPEELKLYYLQKDTWEVYENTVTITSQQFDVAHGRVLSYIQNSDLTYLQALKKELGL